MKVTALSAPDPYMAKSFSSHVALYELPALCPGDHCRGPAYTPANTTGALTSETASNAAVNRTRLIGTLLPRAGRSWGASCLTARKRRVNCRKGTVAAVRGPAESDWLERLG